jgi:hypothetical protein
MLSYLKTVFGECMALPDANTRLVYLLQGAAVAAGVLVVSVGFLFASPAKEMMCPEMIMALAGGTVASAAGRAGVRYSARIGTSDPPVTPPPEATKTP